MACLQEENEAVASAHVKVAIQAADMLASASQMNGELVPVVAVADLWKATDGFDSKCAYISRSHLIHCYI